MIAQPQGHEPRFESFDPTEEIPYQALSGLAVVALLVGLLSWIAFLSPALVVVPLAGFLLSAVALTRIARQSPALIGRKVALAGLVLSLLFGIAAPAERSTYRWLLRREARQVAFQWFDYLRNDQPSDAMGLSIDPLARRPMQEYLLYREELTSFVAVPAVRAILALGEKAVVRHYRTDMQGLEDGLQTIHQAYAVTWEEDGRKHTFFIGLNLERPYLSKLGVADWQVIITDESHWPDGLPAAPAGGA